MSREDLRGDHFEENHYNDRFHGEMSQMIDADDESNYDKYRDRTAYRGGARGRFNRRGHFNRRGRGWPRGNRPQPQRDQNPSIEQQRFRDEDEFCDEPEPAWEESDAQQTWGDEDRGTEMATLPSHDLEMQQPQKQWGHNETQPNMMVIAKETLTIKVDMSRPVNKNRYSMRCFTQELREFILGKYQQVSRGDEER